MKLQEAKSTTSTFKMPKGLAGEPEQEKDGVDTKAEPAAMILSQMDCGHTRSLGEIVYSWRTPLSQRPSIRPETHSWRVVLPTCGVLGDEARHLSDMNIEKTRKDDSNALTS